MKQTKEFSNILEKSIIKRPLLIIVILASAVYFQTLTFDYIYYDDQELLMDNEIRISRLTNFWEALTSRYIVTSFYRPVVNVSFWLDAQFGGEDPFMHHLTNLIFHLVASCLLFVFFRKLKLAAIPSFWLALIFAVHPILTNAVAWIVGRCDILAGLFGVASFICFIDYIEKRKTLHLALNVIFFVLALYSKIVAIVFPGLFILYWWFFAENKKVGRKEVWLMILWVITAVSLPIIRTFMNLILKDYFGQGNWFTNLPVLAETVAKTIIPINIHVLPKFQTSTTVIGTVLIIGIAAVIYYKRKQLDLKKIAFAGIWFFILLFPAMFIRQHERDYLFDYLDCRAYLPIMGLLLILGMILPGRLWDMSKKLNIIILSAVVVVFSAVTIHLSQGYADEQSFRKTANRQDPTMPGVFVDNVAKEIGDIIRKANEAAEAGDHKKAIEYFDQVIARDTMNPSFYQNRGFQKMNIRDLDGAMRDFTKAIKLNEEDSYSLYQRAQIWLKKNDFEKAIEDLNIVIEVEEDNYLAYYHRALAKYYSYDFESALEDNAKVIEIMPEFPDAYLQRGLLMAQFDRMDEACKDLRKALEMGQENARVAIEEYCK